MAAYDRLALARADAEQGRPNLVPSDMRDRFNPRAAEQEIEFRAQACGLTGVRVSHANCDEYPCLVLVAARSEEDYAWLSACEDGTEYGVDIGTQVILTNDQGRQDLRVMSVYGGDRVLLHEDEEGMHMEARRLQWRTEAFVAALTAEDEDGNGPR